ncbi:ABC transporter permease [Ethanoligenens sp.]|uniref:ABC transporter permease n=1 Tax=Ethanoligenens sp. TaxID=2099655 RepID=UPI0039EC5368
MFAHIYTHRLKCQLRDRSNLFWSIIFPLVLATFFSMAFSNIGKSDMFSEIPIAVVNNPAYQQDTSFQQAIQSVGSKQANGTKALFKVQLLSQAQADDALKNNKIDGYILPSDSDENMQVIVKESNTGQTILKSFVDEYLQYTAAYKDIATQNPAAMRTAMQVKTQAFIRTVSLSKTTPKASVTYFYALIAMACMYGSFWGLREINAVQANQTMQGARVNMAPVHKTRVFFASLCAALTVQTAGVFLLVGYMRFALNVQFGSQTGYILLACFAGSMAGVLFGAVVGAALKIGEGLKMAILIGLSMLLSFLSGLMYNKMIYIIETHIPLLNRINPAALTANAFYSLYYYDTPGQYLRNVGLLFVISGIFFAIIYFALRRQKYESL